MIDDNNVGIPINAENLGYLPDSIAQYLIKRYDEITSGEETDIKK